MLCMLINLRITAAIYTGGFRCTVHRIPPTLRRRCASFNPNPSVDPDFNVVQEYTLQRKHKLLAARLNDAGIDWSTIEEQTWEVQEYLGYCPIPMAYPLSSVISADRGTNVNHHHHQQQQHHGGRHMAPPPPPPPFRMFVYPSADEFEGKLPAVYQAVRSALMASPYRTLDPADASVFIPPTDVSCWCERCLGNRPFEAPALASKEVTNHLRSLAHWGTDGRNHVIFEFSDAPCVSYHTDAAILAAVGLSTFHHRPKVDVSMPLFAMVEYSKEQRRRAPNDRKYLLTFRGTRSKGSDQMRRQLWKIHNGVDVVVPCACRWYQPAVTTDYGKSARVNNGYALMRCV